MLFGPGTDSGTFDYFTDAINGEEGASRTDYHAERGRQRHHPGVTGDEGGIGYFGFSYYEQNQDKLKAVEIDSGDGCVAPTVETAQDGTYTPLSRPLFVYVKTSRSRGQRCASSSRTTSTTSRSPRPRTSCRSPDEQLAETPRSSTPAARRRSGDARRHRRRAAAPIRLRAAQARTARTSSRSSSACARSSRCSRRSRSSSRCSSRRSSSSARSRWSTSSRAPTGRRSSSRRVRRAVPLLVGTLVVTFWACLVAFRSVSARRSTSASTRTPRARNVLKPALEVLAGIPTVVFGYFALTFVHAVPARHRRAASRSSTRSRRASSWASCSSRSSRRSPRTRCSPCRRISVTAPTRWARHASRSRRGSSSPPPSRASSRASCWPSRAAIGETMIVLIAAGQLAQI